MPPLNPTKAFTPHCSQPAFGARLLVYNPPPRVYNVHRDGPMIGAMIHQFQQASFDKAQADDFLTTDPNDVLVLTISDDERNLNGLVALYGEYLTRFWLKIERLLTSHLDDHPLGAALANPLIKLAVEQLQQQPPDEQNHLLLTDAHWYAASRMAFGELYDEVQSEGGVLHL